MNQEGKDPGQAFVEVLNEFIRATALPRWRDMFIEQHWTRKKNASPNPLLRHGEKFFSQNDEDGILLAICGRIGLQHGVFVEIGVGNGLENNSLILLMSGWRGVWLGAEALAFEAPDGGPLLFQECWVTKENCPSLLAHGLAALGASQPNLLSVDVDGNDLYLLEAALGSGTAPDIVVAEYNAKFPPPIRWSVAYDPGHTWDGSDYQGASLQSLVDLLERFDYRLVACNVTGINAFFVKNVHAPKFADVPRAIEQLFMSADYNWFVAKGLPTSPRTIAQFLKRP